MDLTIDTAKFEWPRASAKVSELGESLNLCCPSLVKWMEYAEFVSEIMFGQMQGGRPMHTCKWLAANQTVLITCWRCLCSSVSDVTHLTRSYESQLCLVDSVLSHNRRWIHHSHHSDWDGLAYHGERRERLDVIELQCASHCIMWQLFFSPQTAVVRVWFIKCVCVCVFVFVNLCMFVNLCVCVCVSVDL